MITTAYKSVYNFGKILNKSVCLRTHKQFNKGKITLWMKYAHTCSFVMKRFRGIFGRFAQEDCIFLFVASTFEVMTVQLNILILLTIVGDRDMCFTLPSFSKSNQTRRVLSVN